MAAKQSTTVSRRRFLQGLLAATAAGCAPLDPIGTVEIERERDDPDLVLYNRRDGMRFLDARGHFVAARGNYYAPPVRLDNLPQHLIDALIAQEDRRFWKHDGLDYWSIARATVRNVEAWAGGDLRIKQGGSTITQQTLKEIFFREDDRYMRKGKELLNAQSFEESQSKEDILFLYFNRVHFGQDTYGIQAAARVYFDKHPHQLTVMESAMLVGILRGPNGWNPHSDYEHTIKHAQEVIEKMTAEGLLPRRAVKAHKRDRPSVAPAERIVRNEGYHRAGPQVGYFAQWAQTQARRVAKIQPGVSVVRTTLDPAVQRIAEQELGRALARDGARFAIDQGGVVVMSHSGDVLAMVGGRDFRTSRWNTAFQARRQPGSAFKLFVYLAALERGMSPDDMISDAPMPTRSGPAIRNVDGQYGGDITLRRALAVSSNVAAARLATGHVPAIAKVARRLGVTSKLAGDIGVALGTSEVSLLELTAAYATIANSGILATPSGVLDIRDNENLRIYARPSAPAKQVVRPAHAHMLQSMLAETIRAGTGRAADPGFWAAGKTGTTDDYRDAWFIGFTERYVAGVWLGNEDNRPMRGVTGGGTPAEIWRTIMQKAHKRPTAA